MKPSSAKYLPFFVLEGSPLFLHITRHPRAYTGLENLRDPQRTSESFSPWKDSFQRRARGAIFAFQELSR